VMFPAPEEDLSVNWTVAGAQATVRFELKATMGKGKTVMYPVFWVVLEPSLLRATRMTV